MRFLTPCLFFLPFILSFPSHSRVFINSEVELIKVREDLSLPVGSVAIGMGGAGQAGDEGPESLLLNPALVVRGGLKDYSVFYTFQKPKGEEKVSTYGLSFIQNNKKNLFSMGLSYLKTPKENLGNSFFQITFGKRISRYWSWGLGFYRMKNKLEGSSQKHKQWNGILGTTYQSPRGWKVGWSYAHFLSEPKGLPPELSQSPQIRVGVQTLLKGRGRLRADTIIPLEENPQRRFIWRFGLETSLVAALVLRTGVETDALRDKTSYTGGLGFRVGAWILDYGFKKGKNEGSIKEIPLHSITLRNISF